MVSSIGMLLFHPTFDSLFLSKQPMFVIGQVTIKTDSMEVAGDIIQDMASYLGIGELQSSAVFPVELEAFQDVLTKVLAALCVGDCLSIVLDCQCTVWKS